jgi:TonB family protein
MTSRRFLLLAATLLLARPTFAAGLEGLGPPGQLKGPSGAVKKAEASVLNSLQKMRKKGQAPLKSTTLLAAFARENARKAATGETDGAAIPKLIEKRRLAPFGYIFRFAAGKNAREVAAVLRKDKAFREALRGEFSNVGIGVFEVPTEEPYLQTMVLLTKNIDPKAGQPGLSRADTDPVMRRAAETIRRDCYETQLKKNPNLRGDILAELVIGATGAVTSATLRKKLGVELFDVCALAKLNQLRFPKPYKAKPVTLRSPFRFTPPHGEKVIGVLEPTRIRATFATKASEFRACQEKRRKELAGKKLRGKILLDITVSPTGNIKSLDVKTDSVGDSQLSQCALDIVRGLQFPAPKFGGDASFEFPLSFR